MLRKHTCECRLACAYISSYSDVHIYSVGNTNISIVSYLWKVFDMEGKQKFIQVILPLKLEWEPYYKVPDGVEVQEGDRVWLSFAGRPYLAVVSHTDAVPDEDIKISSIKEFHYKDEKIAPILPTELALWRTAAEYYLCTVGEVYKVAYPPLRADNAVSKSKKEEFVPMGKEPELDEKTKALADAVERAIHADGAGLAGAEAVADADGAGRSGGLAGAETVERNENNEPANNPCRQIRTAPKPLLLQCPQANDIFQSLCHRTSGNILWCVPEQTFSKALEKKLKKDLGSRLVVWTSALTPARKRAALEAIRSNRSYIILGTRSALFLPHKNLSLIMVQDEHDSSYKQVSPAPRYNARDTAVMLASIMHCPIILSSATPSLESIYNCMTGRYISICQTDAPTVEYEVIDTVAEMRKRGMVGQVPLKLIHYCKANACTPAFYKPRKALFPKIEELLPGLEATFAPEVFVSDDLVGKPLPEGTQCLAIYGVDALLGRNDFRADEKALQTIAGAGGQMESLGKKECSPKIFIITRESSHPVFSAVRNGITPLLEERKMFGFPPYSRLIDIKFSDPFPYRQQKMEKELSALIMAENLCRIMPDSDGLRLIFAKDKLLRERKARFRALLAEFEKSRKYFSHITVDVDPL